MARPRVLIADDHKIVVEELKKMLEPDFDIACTVEDGRELVTSAEARIPIDALAGLFGCDLRLVARMLGYPQIRMS